MSQQSDHCVVVCTTRLSRLRRHELGLIDDAQWARFQQKQANLVAERTRLGLTRVQPDAPVAVAMAEASGQNVREVRLLRL